MDVPGKEHAATAAKHVKKLPPWALVAVGIGGLMFAYMIYKSRQASAAADAGGTGDGGAYTDPYLAGGGAVDYSGSGGSVPIAGASMGAGGFGYADPGTATIPTGAGTGVSTATDTSQSASTDNSVTGENVAGVLTAAGNLVGAGFNMGRMSPTTGGGPPARPAAVHAPPTKKDAQGHTAAQRAQIRASSPASEKAYQARVQAKKKK